MSNSAGRAATTATPKLNKRVPRDADDDEPQGASCNAEDEPVYSNWVKRKGIYRPCGATQKKVAAGIYGIDNDNEGWYLEKMQFPSDDLLRLPGMPIDFILNQIGNFWDREHLFKQVKLLHKRGILLYGPVGCGKTSIIKLLCNDIVSKDGIVLIITNCRLAEGVLQGIRQIEPRRPILTIIEDIETFMTQGEESSSARALLAFLDGETQVDHIVHLATTNKPEQLEDRIVKRPGRFDVVVEILQPVRAAREAYLRNLLRNAEMEEKKLQLLADETHGLGLCSPA